MLFAINGRAAEGETIAVSHDVLASTWAVEGLAPGIIYPRIPGHEVIGDKGIEVTNSYEHSSHAQACRMRPLRLNADSSAISRMLPQRGHLGRRKSCVTGSGALQAYWTVIVDPPRRSHTHPIYPDAAYDA
jgi:hypothetical protein